MTWDQFWASVLPAYLGAIGSIAASAVAVVALIRDIRTRRGLKEVAQSAVSTATMPADRPTLAPRMDDRDSDQPLELVARGSQTVIRNLSPESIEILAISVPSGGKDITFRNTLPESVHPGEGFGLIVHDLLDGPAIAALVVEWKGADGQVRQTRFFV